MKTKYNIVRKLNAIKNKLGKERDALRELQYEIDDLLADKDEDITKLDEIIDSLSRYV